ncbi:uncharacterized protein METZ01_LOCUS46992 [marine metagenome]|uniref:Uncharacterized protein n=1 Tax=marine metagenome TaxID=408172 RepID=A0A381RT20_9ZZZZ
MTVLGAADGAPMTGGGGYQDYADQEENDECPVGA